MLAASFKSSLCVVGKPTHSHPEASPVRAEMMLHCRTLRSYLVQGLIRLCT